MWQDTVIAVCQLAFLPAMLPTLLGKDKPALTTSIANAVIVSIITFSLATLQLWFATITGAMIAAIWSILAIQKFAQDKR
jgi:hypothetical protein